LRKKKWRIMMSLWMMKRIRVKNKAKGKKVSPTFFYKIKI
jgi:hypothetical protein